MPVGEVVTLALNDSQRQLDMGMFCVFSFLGPLAIVAVLLVLLQIIGVSILAGYAVMVAFMPLQRFVTLAMGRVGARAKGFWGNVLSGGKGWAPVLLLHVWVVFGGNALLAVLRHQIRRRTVPLTSVRTSAMNEVLTGIKLIKLYAWEKSFAVVIGEHRKREVESLMRAAWAHTVQTTLGWTMPVMM